MAPGIKIAFVAAATTCLYVAGLALAQEPPEEHGALRLVVRAIPEEDPGPPFYARLGMQEFHTDGWLVVVFYRHPSCVPPDFELTETYHFPDDTGPGAFACEATVAGHTLTEPDAPATRFPWVALLRGRGDVPVWFVPFDRYETLADEEPVTVGSLGELDPLVGSASHYHETLHPRASGHRIDAVASGSLEDGRTFRYQVAERDGEVVDISLAFK